MGSPGGHFTELVSLALTTAAPQFVFDFCEKAESLRGLGVGVFAPSGVGNWPAFSFEIGVLMRRSSFKQGGNEAGIFARWRR